MLVPARIVKNMVIYSIERPFSIAAIEAGLKLETCVGCIGCATEVVLPCSLEELVAHGQKTDHPITLTDSRTRSLQ